MRIIFNKNKFVHTKEIFKKHKILNTYQLNILSNIIFMHLVENETAPFIFLTKFCNLTMPIQQIFWLLTFNTNPETERR